VQEDLYIDWDGLPERIRQGMRRNGLSYRGLARQMDVSPEAIRNWLNGSRITIDRATRLAPLLGLTTRELLGGPRRPVREAAAERLELQRATDLLRRIALLREHLESTVPELMEVLREAQELVEQKDRPRV
jgi:transcriptional regulator with XRE-family HTH domain